MLAAGRMSRSCAPHSSRPFRRRGRSQQYIEVRRCMLKPADVVRDDESWTANAEWFKALADPIRIRILNLLANNESAVCVCDIVRHFPIGQPTISHHLKILRDTRFVFAERRGTFMYYRMNRKCLAEFPNAARLHHERLSSRSVAFPSM